MILDRKPKPRPAISAHLVGHRLTVWPRLRRTQQLAYASAFLLIALVVTACSSTTARSHASVGGTATYALGAGYKIDYIFPIVNSANQSVANLDDFQPLMYRPLYTFGAQGTVALSGAQSLAYAPKFTVIDGKTVATITLKHYIWSNGVPVTSRDIQFDVNLIAANKANFAGYIPGEFPDNVVSVSDPSTYTVQITFNSIYSQYWLLYSELSLITPLPQQSWDKTSPTGPVGNYDETHAGAVAVYNFLNGQSTDLVSYATNPLWQVVDGPWKLQSYDATTGYTVLKRNPRFSGPSTRTGVARIALVPFTTDTAEFDALRAGQLDYGYIPLESIGQEREIKSLGYSIQPWQGWAITFILMNFTNPKMKPIFDQLYIRQAMQHLIDQSAFIKDIFHGDAAPGYGPFPSEPASPFLRSSAKTNPYPYDVKEAVSLLSAHGWAVKPGGTTTCERPGTGPSQCGAGITAGEPLSLSLIYDNAFFAVPIEAQVIKSAFEQAGIGLALSTAPETTLFAVVGPCTTGATCSWELGDWEDPASWVFPSAYPTGDILFACGAGTGGGYCNSQVDGAIDAIHKTSSLTAAYNYESLVAKELPVLWLPTPVYQVSAVKSTLTGTLPQDPLENIFPERWSFRS